MPIDSIYVPPPYAAAGAWPADNWGLRPDGSDSTAAWVALLQTVAASGGRAHIAFGAGVYGIGAHRPVTGLVDVTVAGLGIGHTTIRALDGVVDYVRPDATVAARSYRTTPLWFDGLERLEIRDLCIDGLLVAQAGVLTPWAELATGWSSGAPTVYPTWGQSGPLVGQQLVFGALDAEAGQYLVATVTAQAADSITLSAPLTTAFFGPSDDTDVAFAVVPAAALGGAGIDARNIGTLDIRGVEIRDCFKYGLFVESIGKMTLDPNCHFHDVGMQGPYGHATPYPWIGATNDTGTVYGYSVADCTITGGVYEESSGQGIYLRTRLGIRDFGALPPPFMDVAVLGATVRGHGCLDPYLTVGSGIDLVNNRADVPTRRLQVSDCRITNTSDGPIWLAAQDGLVQVADNIIDTGYGPSIAVDAPAFNITGNILKNSGNGGIFVSPVVSGDWQAKSAMDAPDNIIAHNQVLGSLTYGIMIGTGNSAKPVRAPRRILVDANIVRDCQQQGIYLQNPDGAVVLSNNAVRDCQQVTLDATTTTAATPTAQDVAGKRPWTTIAVVDSTLFKPLEYVTLGGASAYRVARIPDATHLTLEVVPPPTPSGTAVAGAFAGLGAIQVEGRLPFATTVVATTANTVTVADLGAAASGRGIERYDRLRFGADTAIYRADLIAGLVITLDRPFDAATIAGGWTAVGQLVTLANAYPASEVQIRGGLVGCDPLGPTPHLNGIVLVRTQPPFQVEGVQIRGARRSGIRVEDTPPAVGAGPGGVLRANVIGGVGRDTTQTATLRAAVSVVTTAANPTGTNVGLLVEDNRLQAEDGLALYGLVLDGVNVAAGRAQGNDWSQAQTRAYEVANGASLQPWNREDTVYPFYSPNNDDIELIEEFPPSVTGTTGQVGTHGLNSGGTISVLTPIAGLTGGRIVTNNAAVLGFLSLGVLANALVDAAEGWEWIGYFLCLHADGQYRAGMLGDPATQAPLAANDNGAYFERLITDANWQFVTVNGGAKTRADTGVTFGSTGNYWNARIRRTVAGGVAQAQWSLTRVYGNVADRKGLGQATANLPAAGTPLCAVALQVYDGAGGAANKQGRVERLVFRVHGVNRA